VVTTGTDYQRATIRQQLEAELRPATPAPPGQPASPQVRACVLGLTSKTSAITAIRVEKARFEGRPALVIIASTTGAKKVWVAGPGCSAARGDVLYSTTLPVQDPGSTGSQRPQAGGGGPAGGPVPAIEVYRGVAEQGKPGHVGGVESVSAGSEMFNGGRGADHLPAATAP
jgi:hypothetical protein